MIPLATAAQMKELDRAAIEERGIPSLDLMERAAGAVARAVMDLAPLPDPEKDENGPATVSFTSVVFASPEGEEPSEEDRRQMEAVRAIVESKNTDPIPRVAVFCGPGNNGGDGFAAARLLLDAGYSVRTYFIGDRAKLTCDAAVNYGRLEEAGGEVEPFRLDLDHPETMDFAAQLQIAWLSTCDCAVDALFGVGLSRPVEGLYRSAIQYLNRMGSRLSVVACDIPSGVHTDTGEVLGEAVNAKVTVTFTCGKPGLYLGRGAECAGDVRIVDIGIPRDLMHKNMIRAKERLEAVRPDDFRLPRRPLAAHKGDFGKVFILAGNVGYTGAPVMAADAAVRSGAGLVYLGVPEDIYPIVAVKCLEAMPFPLPGDYSALLEKIKSCNVALIGPGLGRAPEMDELVLRLLADLDIPVVLDADGINALAGRLDVLDARRAPTVLTPHDGEFARLTGASLPLSHRLDAARSFAKAHGCVLILKGHGTVTAAPDGLCRINTTGGPGMARGGSGDALAGILAALLGQKPLNGPRASLSELAAAAVCYHGLAGDIAAERRGEYGMTVADLIDSIPEALQRCVEHDWA